MAAAASSPLCISSAGVSICRSIPVVSRMPRTFICGSPLVISGGTHHHHHHHDQKVVTRKARVRCEQSSSGGLDVWLGRTAMVGFAVAIGVEISTGKGLLENFGLTSPLPTVALAVTVLVGVLTAVFIFQSASSEN